MSLDYFYYYSDYSVIPVYCFGGFVSREANGFSNTE